MNTRDLIELATLIGGIIVSVYGTISQMRKRREGDAELAATAGAAKVSHAKAIQDISGLDQTYLAQVSANMANLEAKLAQAEALLREHGIIKGPKLG